MIVTGIVGPKIANYAHYQSGLNAPFGCSAVILLVACTPLAVALFVSQRRSGGADETSSDNTPTGKQPGRLGRFAVELNLPGTCLVTAALCLCFLPLTHITGTQDGWSKATVITMLVLGVCFGVGFYIWESRLTPYTCVPWNIQKDWSITGACLVAAFSVLSGSLWAPYYSSYLEVVHDYTSSLAGSITALRPFSGALAAPLVGL